MPEGAACPPSTDLWWKVIFAPAYSLSSGSTLETIERCLIPAPGTILPVGDSNERAKEAADARCERDRVVEATLRGIGARVLTSEKTLPEDPLMPAILHACDTGMIRSTRGSAPCQASSQPWVIAAASLGSGMAFLDSTVMNVALPALQADLGASAPAWGLGSPRVIAAVIVGVISLSAFVLVEQHARDPMVPPSLFHSRSFAGANLVTLLFYMALTGSLFFLPFLMMQVHGYSAFVAGSVFLPFVAMALLIGRLSGRISARFGATVPLIVASLAVAVGLLLFAMPGADHGSYWTSFFPAMVIQGFGMALAITPLTTVALGSVEGEHSGLASGVSNAMARVAGLLAVAVLGAFIYGAFSARLDARIEDMNVPDEIQSAMEAAKSDLGAAEAPERVDARTEARIERVIDESFVAGFRFVMLASAGLALASALVAALLVRDQKFPSTG